MKTNCPKCNKEFNITEEMLWKKAKCSDCQNIFILWDNTKNSVSESKETSQQLEKNVLNESIELKPNKLSYLFFWNIITIFFWIFTLVLFVLWMFYSWFLIWSFLFLVLWLISLFLSLIQYKKEKYTFLGSKIIYDYWTLFSDNSVEININKITQVKCRVWFIENKLFNTWTIWIKTAWSNSWKIFIKNISNPIEMYQKIQEMMRKNWFSLQKENLVMEAKPHFIWAFWESIVWLWINIFFLFYFWIWIFSELWSDTSELNDLDVSWISPTFIVLFVFFVIIVPIILRIIFRYLDLRRRVYEVYDDSIFYTEWFLNKHYSFLPMENVSDVENSQSFFSKIFWIHDVVVSSEWSDNSVRFFNMVNWNKMMETIKYLKENAWKSNKNPGNNSTEAWEKNDIKATENQNISVEKKFNKDYKDIFKPNLLKVFILNIPFIILVYTIPIFIINFVKALFTTYHVTSWSFEYKFQFISTKHNVFSLDKVTKIVFKESIIDRFLWTCSISFNSIWSSNRINFSHIKKTPDLYLNILSKVWIYKEETTKILPIKYSFQELFKSNIYSMIFLFIISIPLLFIPIIFAYFYNKYFYNSKNYINTIYKTYIESIAWIIIKTRSYAFLEDIKSLQVTKYPFSNNWGFIFDVSWDNMVEYSKKTNQVKITPNGIRVSMVENCFDLFEETEFILNNNNIIEKKVLAEEKQDLWNTLLFVIPLSILLLIVPPLIILVIFIIFFVILYIKSKKYLLENSRVISLFWVIYKSKKSILYRKIDFVSKNKWFVNKLFWNGCISIFTKWSWAVDMNIKDISNYEEFYKILSEEVK